VSRAINLSLPETDVRAHCTESGVSITVMEPLQSGGTHLVCATSAGADELRLRLRNHIIKGIVRRFSFHGSTGPW